MGIPQIERGAERISLPTVKAQALLIYLIIEFRRNPDRRIAKEELADLFWQGMPMPSALQNLRQTLYQIRKAIPEVSAGNAETVPLLESDRKCVGIHTDARGLYTDIDGVFAAAGKAKMQALPQMETVVDSLGGIFLENFHVPGAPAFDQWIEEIRESLGQVKRDYLEVLTQQYRDSGPPLKAVQFSERLREEDPLLERYQSYYLQALSASGQRNKALQAYQAYERLLDSELGISPGTEIQALYENIRQTPVASIARRSPQISRFRPFWGFLAGGVVLVLIAWLFWKPESIDTSSKPIRLAVLPFENNTSQEYLADGLTDDIISRLTKVSGVQMISRQSSSQYREVDKNLSEIGSALRVPFLLTGSVLEQEEQFQVAVQLLEAETGELLWADVFQRSGQELFSFQQVIAQQVAQHLQETFDLEGAELGYDLPTENVEAYNLYLQGRYTFYQANPKALDQAVELFQEALAIAPDYDLAHAWLAWTYCSQAGSWGDQPAEAVFPLVQRELSHIENKPELQGFYHRVLGWMYLWQLDQENAEKHLREAVRYDPNVEFGLSGLAMVLTLRRKFDEAIQVAREGLHTNPHFFWNHFGLAQAYYYKGEFVNALAVIEAGLALSTHHEASLSLKGKILNKLGRSKEAITFLEESLETLGFRSSPLLPDLGIAYVALGNTEQALKIAHELEDRHHQGEMNTGYFAAQIFSAMGEYETAFSLLEEVAANRDNELNWIHVDVEFDAIRDQPRFQAILQGLLPQS